MRLRAVVNKRLGRVRICHDQWCQPGETSVVADILSSLDTDKDLTVAEEICRRWNMVEDMIQ